MFLEFSVLLSVGADLRLCMADDERLAPARPANLAAYAASEPLKSPKP